jgi:hypothetical protein
VVGAILGGFFARRNEEKAHGEKLLVDALNDAMTAIADVASGEAAQNRYASAVARIALHASPGVVEKFWKFQEEATTATPEGRALLIAAVQEARRELGHGRVDDEVIAVLLFGSSQPEKRFVARCATWETALLGEEHHL